jgi:flagellar assembly factor FliW
MDLDSHPMALEVQSSRFGTVEIAEETVVAFPDGLIGLGGSRYALISNDPDSPFLWLQSLDDPAVALPVTNPLRFFADYAVELSDEDADRLGFDSEASVDVYVTVTATPDPSHCTANLRAPILIRPGRADQVINHAPGAVLRAQLFGEKSAAAQAC